jgi:2-polyprenyl-3-methyl-5-hydroxy-6-metoxy-1,4-benzoquinol methylase
MDTRTESFGQGHRLTPVDRLGIWLSHRQISRWVDLRGKRVADLGCGHQAQLVRAVLDDVAQATLIDVALAPELKTHPRVTAIEGQLPDALASVPAAALDVVLCINVLEHLLRPREMLAEIHRILAPGGRALINVPSWRGKRFLELSAFRLGLSPRAEMDDHKMYYDVRDLWPLLVEAGFRPSGLRCWPHKLGLNTFAVCEKDVGASR